MKTCFRLLSLFSLLALAPVLRAEDIGTVQRRMQARLPVVDQMKQTAVVGENNLGLLEARGALTGEQSTAVNQENADRTLVYTELAKKNGTSAEQVGKLRAKQIADRSAPGIWLQDESGRWYKK